MIFSLFGKKDGRGDRKRGAEQAPSRAESAPGGPPVVPARTADPREIARLTAAKIDEIESEMIAATKPRSVDGARGTGSRAGLAGTVYVPSGVAAAAPAAASTGPAESSVAGSASVAARTPGGALPTLPPQNTSIILGNGDAGLLSMEVGGTTLPPAFEEAAVLYSNGQATAAGTILWQAINDNSLGGHARQGWAMLFDLYQAIGRKEDFESLAIDYSARFETSPPTWDDSVAPPSDDAAARAAAAAGASASVALPVTLDAQSVKQFEQVQRFAQRNRGVVLDVSPVRSVDPLGADLLRRVLTAFGRSKVELGVQGVESLFDVLSSTIEAGRRDPSEACWLLQLDLLRLLNRQQAFDDLAIDYCVTYEVSPPPWEPMPPMVRLAAPGARAGLDPSAPRPAGEGGFCVGPDAFLLTGELTGRSQEALASLRGYAADRAEVVVDCRSLRRLDFAAAGELLNEVVALRTGGKYLVFRDLNHLVAALLAVMGIPDLAEVRLRRH